MLESIDCFFSARRRSGPEPLAWSERMAMMPDEDLIRLASLSVQAVELATDTDFNRYISLAAACNYELVIRRARVGIAS
jgi:hypothetical protein